MFASAPFKRAFLFLFQILRKNFDFLNLDKSNVVRQQAKNINLASSAVTKFEVKEKRILKG